jgi:hypothetical protein
MIARLAIFNQIFNFHNLIMVAINTFYFRPSGWRAAIQHWQNPEPAQMKISCIYGYQKVEDKWDVE